MTTTEKIANAK